MEAIRNPDDYVIWLQGVFDSIGDRPPSDAEWKMIKERHALMAGEIVLQRLEKRQREFEFKQKLDEATRLAEAQAKSYQTYSSTTLGQLMGMSKVSNQLAQSAQSAINFGTLTTDEE